MFQTTFSSKAAESGALPVDTYATCADFCKVFNDNVDALYMLSLLLTADPVMAEQCFLSALENCLRSKTIFKEWAHSWAKRTTIMTAIRIAFGSQKPSGSHIEAGTFKGTSFGAEALVARVSSLDLLDRFVYVLSVLEGISSKECALMLNCSVRDVTEAKVRALERTCGLHQTSGASSRGALALVDQQERLKSGSALESP